MYMLWINGYVNSLKEVHSFIMILQCNSSGLSTMLSAESDVGEVETFLQLSARWANTPLQQLTSISNLGSFFWVKAVKDVSNNTNNGNDSKDSKDSTVDAIQTNIHAQEALAYWEEALAEASNGVFDENIQNVSYLPIFFS